MSLDPLSLAQRLTLLGLVLQPIGGGWIRTSTLGLAVTGLLFAQALQRPSLWAALALLAGVRVGLDWPLADNHAYLLSYWCLAIALSLLAEEAQPTLARHGRALIALVFAFSILWKGLLSPDFLDGRFFRVTLLTDPRFEDFVRLATGLSSDQIEWQRTALMQHADGGMVMPLDAPRPLPRAFDRLAGLPIAMGVAQCEAPRNRVHLVYMACFALVLFYREVPWAGLLADWLGRA